MINRSEEEIHCVRKTVKRAVLCCFHKYITHFWENKSVTPNKHASQQKWIWKYGFLIKISHNGYYQISPPNLTAENRLIFLAVLTRGIPLGHLHRWGLLTYLKAGNNYRRSILLIWLHCWNKWRQEWNKWLAVQQILHLLFSCVLWLLCKAFTGKRLSFNANLRSFHFHVLFSFRQN